MSKPANPCRKSYHLAGSSLAGFALTMVSATAVSAAEPAPAGAILRSVIRAKGELRRCV